jgi:hypothetical protein
MYRLNLLFFSFLIPLFIFSSCKKSKRESVSRGFYYWKSRFQLAPNEQKELISLGATKLYVKFFDVDWNEDVGEPQPYATIQPKGVLDSSFHIVPTVFITNRTFEKLDENRISSLKRNVYNKISQLLNCFDNDLTIQEIQIDCDWNESTREKYFKFLKDLKKEIGKDKKLSVTIRLHQVKYFEKTGIPPVDRGMLMFYNMGQVENLNSDNSIFNEEDASKYLFNFDKYPLPLDVALPVFSWVAIFRQNKLFQLVNDFEPSLSGNKNIVQIAPNTFKVKELIEMKSYLLNPGDIIKFEVLKPENTLKAAEMIKPHLNDTLSVILFDYNELNLKRYEESDLQKIYDSFN